MMDIVEPMVNIRIVNVHQILHVYRNGKTKLLHSAFFAFTGSHCECPTSESVPLRNNGDSRRGFSCKCTRTGR